MNIINLFGEIFVRNMTDMMVFFPVTLSRLPEVHRPQVENRYKHNVMKYSDATKIKFGTSQK